MSMLLVGRCCAVAGLGVGLVALAGYASRVDWMVRVEPSLPPMYPNTALALVCAGMASLAVSGVGRSRRTMAAVLAGAVTATGAIGFVLHLIGAPVGWYEALWPADPFVAATTPTPGRPVVETCVSLSLVGASLLLLARQRAPRVAQALALGSLTIGLTALIGYIVGVDRVDLGSSFVVGMALHTALGITTVSLSALLTRPNVGVMALVTEAGPAGRVARMVALGALAVPLALASAQVLLTRWFDQSRLAGSVITVLQVGLLGALVIVPLVLLERSSEALRATTASRRRDVESKGDEELIVAAVAHEVSEPPPEVDGWPVTVRLEPAHGYLAGDSQQVLPRDDGHVLVAVIDVAGHGAAAGIVALRLRAEVEALWLNALSLEHIYETLNLTVLRQETIATCCLVDIELRSGAVRYLNAGHPPGLLVHAVAMTDLAMTCPLLGLPDSIPTTRTESMRHGDLVVLYTDGVTEARDDTGTQLGNVSLKRIVRARAAEGTDAVAHACIDAALEHTGGRLNDDALVVTLERR
jgi:hypothetical protein